MAESVIQEVIGKIVDYSADALKKQVNYLCCYSCNVQILADEVGELNIRHESVQQDVDAARANFGVIRPEVEAWLRKVEELKSRSDEIRGDAEEIQRSSMCKWLPLLHYSLSRKAFKTAKNSVELRNTKFDKIFNPLILAEIAPVPTTSNVGFQSRNLIEDRIMDALKDPSVYSIGIWGIGGVGKTVMAIKIEEKVRNEKSLFEHVVMVVVSQQPDLPKLQIQIAEGLNLTLSEECPVLRQRKLHRRLMAEKSILIILDDLWERLDLEEFGIPSQTTHARCKLILTSRNRDVLTSTGVPMQNIFPLETLTKEESWRFFRDNVGISLEDVDSHNELVQIAKKVERECKGLPLALKIVAFALKGKDISFWDNAVRELEKSVPDNIPDVTKHVYKPLMYSINALEGKEQKDLFLLCCLFPEDYSISIEELLRCGIGLRIFKGLENLTVVRDKVKTMLKILLSRSLLIEGSEYLETFYVRMHDVIRDVGIWIASEGNGMVGSNKEKNLFMVSHGLHEWPLMMEEEYTCISFLFSHPSITFPKSIVCPKLELLRLDFVNKIYRVYNMELPENFFNGIGGLKVLEAFHIGLLHPSIGQLNNLRTLFLERCNIFKIVSVLGKLINLEILSLEDCKLEMLPVEIGGLKKLKQMHISNCKSLRRIAFSVISELARLEELLIMGCFNSWEAKDGGEKDVACLSELNVLENLSTLKIEIKNPSVVPRQKPLWVQKVKKYYITVSNCDSGSNKKYFQKAIVLGKDVVNPLGDWIYDMASDAEYLDLEGSNCMNVLKGLYKNSRNLSWLKQLRLSQFTNIRYLAEELQKHAIFPMLETLDITDSASLQHITDVSPPIGSFVALRHINLYNLSGLICLWKVSAKEQFYLKNLRSVKIFQCDNLSYMFSLSVAQSLVQLSSLEVSFCEIMKEIFKKDDGELVEINKIELPKLKFLSFENLKSLCHFCNGIDRIELSQLQSLSLRNLPSMKMTKGDNNEVHQQYLIPKVAGMNFNFCGLTDLEVEGIGNFKCMFSPSVISGVPNLGFLSVKNCSMLEQVIGKDDENIGETILFPNLVNLTLFNLPNILTFCYNAIQLPSLNWLKISHCPQMLKFVEELPNHISNSTSFLNKQVECPKLMSLTMDRLNVSAVFTSQSFKSVTNLNFLELTRCEKLEHVITEEGQSTTNMEEDFIQMIPLKSLTLTKLQKLYGSVFQMKHLEFPSLETIEIQDCPMLEKFSLESVHLPKLRSVSGLLNNEFAVNFLFHGEMSSPKSHSENNCFIISVKDISFSTNLVEDNWLCFLAPGSSGRSFVDAISFPLEDETKKIIGKFKTQKIMTGIVYEIILMIMVDLYDWEDPIETELKLFGGIELQKRTEILGNQAIETWTEISIGKFMMREPQQINEEFEFSLRLRDDLQSWSKYRRLSIKGVKILEEV